jgi:hypothetical protein
VRVLRSDFALTLALSREREREIICAFEARVTSWYGVYMDSTNVTKTSRRSTAHATASTSSLSAQGRT